MSVKNLIEKASAQSHEAGETFDYVVEQAHQRGSEIAAENAARRKDGWISGFEAACGERTRKAIKAWRADLARMEADGQL